MSADQGTLLTNIVLLVFNGYLAWHNYTQAKLNYKIACDNQKIAETNHKNSLELEKLADPYKLRA